MPEIPHWKVAQWSAVAAGQARHEDFFLLEHSSSTLFLITAKCLAPNIHSFRAPGSRPLRRLRVEQTVHLEDLAPGDFHHGTAWEALLRSIAVAAEDALTARIPGRIPRSRTYRALLLPLLLSPRPRDLMSWWARHSRGAFHLLTCLQFLSCALQHQRILGGPYHLPTGWFAVVKSVVPAWQGGAV